MKIVVPLAEGFEEIEGVTIIDILRRGGIDVTTASVMKNPVTGSHNITVVADTDLSSLNPADFDGIVLPGGMPGSKNLRENKDVIDFIKAIYSKNGYLGAVCAAPTVLEQAGVLKGKRATVHPDHASYIKDAILAEDSVVVDGRIITGKGAGPAIDFSLAIVRELQGSETAQKIRSAIQVYWKE